jgi:RNA polymerase sigma-70 factor, ECF subfamily
MKTLYQRRSVRVHRFVLHLVTDAASAEDIVSEVFLALWQQAGRFKRNSVSTWILAIARHCAAARMSHSTTTRRQQSWIRRRMPRRRWNQDRSAIIRRCLSLSAIHREVLDLVYYHEKSVDDVAQIVGVPASTVKTRMFNARRRMESLLKRAGVGLHLDVALSFPRLGKDRDF